MNVSLTPELEALVNTKVKSGHYSSASEVIREGLRLLMERDQMKLAQLRQAIEAGIAEADQGQMVPADEVFSGLRARNAKVRVTKKK